MRILIEPDLIHLKGMLQTRGYQVSIGKSEECPDVYLYSNSRNGFIQSVSAQLHGGISSNSHSLSLIPDFEPSKHGTLLINVCGMDTYAILDAIEHRTYSSLF